MHESDAVTSSDVRLQEPRFTVRLILALKRLKLNLHNQSEQAAFCDDYPKSVGCLRLAVEA